MAILHTWACTRVRLINRIEIPRCSLEAPVPARNPGLQVGIPGTAERIATPMSRFLALLSVMRLPTRNAEGISALVKLLAPGTQAHVTGHWPQRVGLERTAGLAMGSPVSLSQGMPLGTVGIDANSQLRLLLHTSDPAEAREWLPGGQLLLDLQVLLEVYLGWRCTARLQLSIPLHLLPVPVLGRAQVRLGMTAVLGLPTGEEATVHTDTITVNLGRYQGLQLNPCNREVAHVAYRL